MFDTCTPTSCIVEKTGLKPATTRTRTAHSINWTTSRRVRAEEFESPISRVRVGRDNQLRYTRMYVVAQTGLEPTLPASQMRNLNLLGHCTFFINFKEQKSPGLSSCEVSGTKELFYDQNQGKTYSWISWIIITRPVLAGCGCWPAGWFCWMFWFRVLILLFSFFVIYLLSPAFLFITAAKGHFAICSRRPFLVVQSYLSIMYTLKIAFGLFLDSAKSGRFNPQSDNSLLFPESFLILDKYQKKNSTLRKKKICLKLQFYNF